MNQPTTWAGVVGGIAETGLTQQQIGGLCGCSQAVVSAIQRGEATEIRFSTALPLLRLARSRGIDVSHFTDGIVGRARRPTAKSA